MSTQLNPNSERIYALDAMRAIMMLLGIVIHAAITYGSLDNGTDWAVKDPENSWVYDLVAGFIHSFRMPVFFVAAGYFTALLVFKKGVNGMLLNRTKRILFPFLVGVVFVYPLVITAFFYSKLFTLSTPVYENAFDVIFSDMFLPLSVVHLWFLYFLMMFAVLGWMLTIAFQKAQNFILLFDRFFMRIFQNIWLRLLLMSFVLFVCLIWMGVPFILTNNFWKINPSIFVTYFVFFGTGWMIYRTHSLDELKSHALILLAAATILLIVSILVAESWNMYAQQALAAIYSSLYVFGFLALFLTYFNKYSPTLTYLTDAAYWVYIIHLPIVVFIPGLMSDYAWPAFIKFSITLSVTSFICLISYHYLVRGTFIGMFLNGKVMKNK